MRKPKELKMYGVLIASCKPGSTSDHERYVSMIGNGWLTSDKVKTIHAWLGRAIEWMESK